MVDSDGGISPKALEERLVLVRTISQMEVMGHTMSAGNV